MNPKTLTKLCKKCGKCKSLDSFAKRNDTYSGLKSHCKTCNNIQSKDLYSRTSAKVIEKTNEYYKNNPRKYKGYHLKKSFNIGIDEYETMVSKQNNLCAICNKPQLGKLLAVDHCHKSNKIRGLLCQKCNIGLAQFNDDVDLLLKAIEYINKYKKLIKFEPKDL